MGFAAELDHLLWIVPDLAWGIEDFADRTGVQPRVGGSHPWTGTRNALVHLGGVAYIEIVAPDLEQCRSGDGLDGTVGGALLDVEPGLWTFAHNHRDLTGLVDDMTRKGFSTGGPRKWSRRGRDGVVIEWSVAFAGESEFGCAAPFFIDWGELAHPTSAMRKPGLSLLSLTATAEDPGALSAFYASTGITAASFSGAIFTVLEGRPGVSAEVTGPNGAVTLPAVDASRYPLLRSTPSFMFRDA